MIFDLESAYPGQGLVDFWKSLFPDWPDEFINKFSQGISIDAPKFGFQGGADISGFQGWWGAVVSPPAQANYETPMPPFGGDVNITINLLTPGNPRYATQARWDLAFWYGVNLPISIWDTPPQSLQTNMNQAFLGVAFGYWNATLHAYINFDTRLYYNSFQWNYATIGTFTGIDGLFFDGRKASYANKLIVAPNASAAPYQFVDTILALHENGVDNPGLDYNLLYDYQTYRDAYLKYGAQIAAEKNAAKQQQENEIYAYQSELADKLQAEKNSLQNLQLTMKQAMTNETASAARDMAQTFLAAQNLKISLLQALK